MYIHNCYVSGNTIHYIIFYICDTIFIKQFFEFSAKNKNAIVLLLMHMHF